MIFRELLENHTVEDIVNFCAKEDELNELETSELKETYDDFIGKLLSRDVVLTDRVLIGISYSNCRDSDNEIECFKIDTIKNIPVKGNKLETMAIEDVSGIDGEEALGLAQLRITPKNLPFEVRPWEEIIGYRIVADNVEEYGELAFIKDVFFKMTYFGYDEEYIAEAREAIEDTMSIIDDLDDMSEEERASHIFTSERAAASFAFQDNRSESDKLVSMFASARKAIRAKLKEYITVKEVAQALD